MYTKFQYLIMYETVIPAIYRCCHISSSHSYELSATREHIKIISAQIAVG